MAGIWLHRAVAVMVWGYLGCVLAAWVLLAAAGDWWWFATVLLFAPRWVYALPLVVLLPVVLLARRWKLLRVLAAAMVVVACPIMDLRLPLPGFGGGQGTALRVLSLNFDGDTGDRQRLAALLLSEQPDLFAIQECPPSLDDKFFAPWHVRRLGQLLVGSRLPMGEVQTSICRHPATSWQRADGLMVTLQTPDGPVRFCGIHLDTPREGLGHVLSRKVGFAPWRREELEQGIENRRLESEDLVAWLAQFKGPLIVAGDFNMPSDSRIYRANWSKYCNAFSDKGFGYGYTKWTPLKGSHYGLRIDHILTSDRWHVRRAWIGPDVGSDHLPILEDVGR